MSFSDLLKRSGKSQSMDSSKLPTEAMCSKTKGFKNLLELATECLSNRDYMNAEVVYGSLFGDLQKGWLVDALQFNDLDYFSIKCCFAYASVAAESNCESSLMILNSLHSTIKIPLVPYLKSFVHIANENITSAQQEIELCEKLIKEGYNFKSNSILNEEIVPEINNDFLKLKINGLKFACQLITSTEEKTDSKNTFKLHWMRIGKLCEYDFAKVKTNTIMECKAENEKNTLKQIEEKKGAESKANPIKKADATTNTASQNIKNTTTSSTSGTNSTKTKQKKQCHIAVQASVKHVNVHTQTSDKDVNRELLSTLNDIRNRVTNIQNRKEDEIKKLNKKTNDLNDLILLNSEKHCEFEFLKEQYLAVEKKLEESQKKNLLLQRLLADQIQQKNNAHKKMFLFLEEKCNSKMTYLKEGQKLIQPGFKISVDEFKQEIYIWRTILHRVVECKKKFMNCCRHLDEAISSSSIENLEYFDFQDIPSLPIDSQDLVHRNFRNILIDWGQICGEPIRLPPNSKKYLEQLKQKSLHNQHKTISGDKKFMPVPLNMVHHAATNANNTFLMEHEAIMNRRVMTPSPISYVDKRNIPTPNSYYGEQNMPSRDPTPENSHPLPVNAVFGKCQQRDNNPNVSAFWDVEEPEETNPKPIAFAEEKNKYQEAKSLLEFLKQTFEDIDEIHLQEITMRVRDANGGTLDGVTKEKLVELIQKSRKKVPKPDKPAWHEVRTRSKWHNDHSENKCVICFEDFDPLNHYSLPCEHEFHKQCITDWLKQKKDCPVCRVYTVIDEEYPPLN